MNGKFSLYVISIHGLRKGGEAHKDVIATQRNEIELKNLKPRYKYEVEIQAKVFKFSESGDIGGRIEKFAFVAPPGGEKFKFFGCL